MILSKWLGAERKFIKNFIIICILLNSVISQEIIRIITPKDLKTIILNESVKFERLEEVFYQNIKLAANKTHLFALDVGNSQVKIFDLLGKYVRSFGKEGFGPGEFYRPSNIIVSDSIIIVRSNQKNILFSNKNTYLGDFPI